jgi:hypothetical protein
MAAEQGDPVTANPYEPGSDKASCWVEGWLAVKQRPGLAGAGSGHPDVP